MLLLDVGIYDEFYSYTDKHDVDEDITTISVYNGTWISESGAGVVQRYVNNTYTEFDIFVASVKNKD